MIVKPPAEVVDYDPRWPQDFETIRDFLRPVLLSDVTVEHVGSTSVLGLAAKPIIDVDVVTTSAAQVAEVVLRLEEIGYEHLGDGGSSAARRLPCPMLRFPTTTSPAWSPALRPIEITSISVTISAPTHSRSIGTQR